MRKYILMVLDEEFPPDDRVHKEAQSLIKEGFDVAIACYTFSERPKFEEIDGIRIFRKKISKFIYKSSVAALTFPVYFNWWKKYLQEIFQTNTFDIIHIHDLPLTKVGVHFKQKHNLKLVVDLHENWPAVLEKAVHTNTFLGKILSPISLWRKYEKNILKKADLIVTVVEEMKERIAKLGIERKNMTIVHNAISKNRYKNQGECPNKNFFTLFYAGDINYVRGLQNILDDLKIAKKKIKNLRVWIIGKGNYLKKLKKLVEEKGLIDIFSFLGWQPLEEVMKKLENADIGLMTQLRWEQSDCSSPNKLFQYMFKSKPYLVDFSDSINRIANETQSGLVFDHNVKEDFYKKLLYLYQHPEERKKMGENGNKAILTKYNWDNTVKDFLDKYKKL